MTINQALEHKWFDLFDCKALENQSGKGKSGDCILETFYKSNKDSQI